MLLQRHKYPQDYLTKSPYLPGLLTGLVAGFAVGVLFAPRLGKALRKQIADIVGDQAAEVKHHWNKNKNRAGQAVDSIKTNVGLAANQVEDELTIYADKAVKQARKAEEYGRRAFNEADRLANQAGSAVNKVKDTSKLG